MSKGAAGDPLAEALEPTADAAVEQQIAHPDLDSAEQRGIVEAVATAASPLTNDETAALQQKVAAMTGRTVDLRVEVDDSLIGGLTVRVGDTLYDASVRGRLERLRERLVAGAR